MIKKIKQHADNVIQQYVQPVLDQLTGAALPQIYAHPESELLPILERLQQLREKYRPTPWLANTHAHLLYFDLIKKRTIRLNYEAIEPLTMQDGGRTAIAWYGRDLPPDTPTIVILHTVTGSPRSMRELVRDLHQYTGWRIALCLRRGHAAMEMPVPKMNLFGCPQDLKEQLAYIQQQYPDSTLYAAGSSAGTGLLVRYLGDVGLDTPFKAAFALCPGYDTELGFKHVHPFYSRVMAKKLKQHFILPYQQTWINTPEVQALYGVKTLLEFEQRYFKLAGFNDYASYNQVTNPIYVFENVKIPLLILNAADDPVCHIQNLAPYKQSIMRMPNVAVVVTTKGSHCGFYEGVKTKSWATRLMADFFKSHQNLL